MCPRGVERRNEVEKNGVAMMINEIGINFRIGQKAIVCIRFGPAIQEGGVNKLTKLTKKGFAAKKKKCSKVPWRV